MITPAQRAEIRRLYYGEHWKLGTIAAQLGLHRETVRAAVEHESGSVRGGVCRPTALDPYLPFIRDTLAQYPRLRATRIHEMVRQRGYPGSVIQVRRLVRRLRPESTRTVYRRVVTLIGEQAQVDWGSFGKVRIGHGTRAVSGFVMVLGYSRAIAALFTLDQTLESFLRGHVEAFDALGGTARTLVYDNLKRRARPPRHRRPVSTPACSSSPATTTSPPGPARRDAGMRRGKSRRQIQYLRHAFFAARPFRDLDDLNAQFRRWRDDVAHQRRHPEQPDRTVAEVWADEKPRLLPLPAHPFETELVRVVRSGKTPYVRFDRNLYSIPHTHVRKPLTLLASATRVRILDQQTELARHRRSYDTAQTVEDPRIWKACSPPPAKPTSTPPATGSASPSPPPPPSSNGSQSAGRRYDPTQPGCSRCSTTTGRRSWPPPSTTPSNETPSAPAPSLTSSKRAAGNADSNRRSGSRCPTDRDCETSMSGPMTWRPTMPSDETPPTTLETNLRRLGFNRTADDLNDLVALATRKRWSTTVMLEHIVGAELEDRQRRSVERRLTCARLGSLQAPRRLGLELADRLRPPRPRTHPHPRLPRPRRERHPRRSPGTRQDHARQEHRPPGHPRRTLRPLHHRRRPPARPQRTGDRPRPRTTPPPLHPAFAGRVDELGYLAYDARAADLLFQLVSRRYEHRSLLITTNLPFKHWDTVFPNASCAVALIDRLTHHVEILVVEGRSSGSDRRREAELTQRSANDVCRGARPRP